MVFDAHFSGAGVGRGASVTCRERNGVRRLDRGETIGLFRWAFFGPARFGETSPMSLYARLDALKERHASLESRIFDEDNRPQPDAETLPPLKIEKLQIKDEMERIRTSLH